MDSPLTEIEELRPATRAEWLTFGRGAALFFLVTAAVWGALFTAWTSLPYVVPGADIVIQKKFAVLASKSLFSPGDKIRILAFGDSRTMAGIVPSDFNAMAGPGTRLYNFALPGEGKFLGILGAVLAAGNRPDFIFLQTPWDPNQPEPSLWSFLPNDRQIVDAIVPFHALPRNIFTLLVESINSNPVAVYRRNKEEADLVLRNDGYYFIRSQSHFPNDELPPGYTIATDKPNFAPERSLAEKGFEFERLRDLAGRYDFKVVLVPVARRIGEVAPPPPVEGVRELPGVAGFYVLGPDYVTYQPTMFADPVHLNPRGARVYTEYLATMFRKQLSEGRGAL